MVKTGMAEFRRFSILNTSEQIKNQDCSLKLSFYLGFRCALCVWQRWRTRESDYERLERGSGLMSSCDTQRATSVSGRLVAFIAALMIALATLFRDYRGSAVGTAADDGQTNFDSWLPLRRTSKTSLRPPKKTTMTAITVRLAPRFSDRALDWLRRVQFFEGRQ